MVFKSPAQSELIEYVLHILRNSFTKICESEALLYIIENENYTHIKNNKIKSQVLCHKRHVKDYYKTLRGKEQSLATKININSKYIISMSAKCNIKLASSNLICFKESLFLSYFKSLIAIIESRFLTTKDVNDVTKLFFQSKEKLKNFSIELCSLQSSLDEEKKIHTLKVNALNIIADNLSKNLVSKTDVSERKKTLVFEKSNKDINYHKMALEHQISILQTEVLETKHSVAKCCLNNFLQEASLRKRKFKTHNELITWIAKYDQEIISMEEEIDKIKVANIRQQSKVEKMTNRIGEVKEKYEAIMAERGKKLDAIRIKENNVRHFAAIKIQKIFRGHMTRINNKKMNQNFINFK
ncbi:dynein regulatory complex protein 10 isoform X2 [Hydra vulgaris]|uniref:Dynein regulatory complex protein 10 n=1 Tax=Hydra vulgaris TaxID=6087 RepID=A0ABM4BYT9_HYDVU